MNSVSIIICTYNRSASLRQTFESLCQLQPPAVDRWEILLIDNNSTDDTKDICRQYQTRLPIRYIFEKQQGLSFARNRALDEAASDFIVFTDDDVDFDPAWLVRLLAAARAHPECIFFGGRIFPRNEIEPPAWMTKYSRELLSGITMHYDLGDTMRPLVKNETAYGASMAFPKKAFANGLRFRVELGRIGKHMTVHEDVVLMQELIAAGGSGLYVPDAILYHRNAKNRLTEKYVRKWFIGAGITDVRLGKMEAGAHSLFGAPRYLWRQLTVGFIRFAFARVFASSGKWLPSEIGLAYTYGVILEFQRRTKEGAKN